MFDGNTFVDGSPRSISDLGVSVPKIDAAFVWGKNDMTYLFSGNQVIVKSRIFIKQSRHIIFDFSIGSSMKELAEWKAVILRRWTSGGGFLKTSMPSSRGLTVRKCVTFPNN